MVSVAALGFLGGVGGGDGTQFGVRNGVSWRHGGCGGSLIIVSRQVALTEQTKYYYRQRDKHNTKQKHHNIYIRKCVLVKIFVVNNEMFI
jgi:hypothetical protein